MRRWATWAIPAALVFTAVLAGCGSDTGDTTTPVVDEVTAATSTTEARSGTKGATTTRPPGTTTESLVSSRRQMTDKEAAAILDGSEEQILRCANPDELGAATWDYGPIGTDDPRDRTADDALDDAIAAMAEDTSPRPRSGGQPSDVPTTGWVELQGPNRAVVVFVHLGGTTNHLIKVNGDPQQGVWRHSSAVSCLSSG